jgi:hypothetical protein
MNVMHDTGVMGTRSAHRYRGRGGASALMT